MSVNNRLRPFRLNKKMTLKDLAALSGISKTALSLIERGKFIPSLEQAMILSAIFDVSCEDIFYREKPTQKEFALEGGNEKRIRPVTNLTAMKYGHLRVLRRSIPTHKHGCEFWECRCKCGGAVIVRGDHLKDGTTRSCGCLVPEKFQLSGNNNVALY